MTESATLPPPSATQVAARAENAVKTCGRGDAAVHALGGVTIGFPAREFTAITGPSGPYQLAIVLVAGIILGYLAALIPAYRSTKPEVLEAIQVT